FDGRHRRDHDARIRESRRVHREPHRHRQPESLLERHASGDGGRVTPCGVPIFFRDNLHWNERFVRWIWVDRYGRDNRFVSVGLRGPFLWDRSPSVACLRGQGSLRGAAHGGGRPRPLEQNDAGSHGPRSGAADHLKHAGTRPVMVDASATQTFTIIAWDPDGDLLTYTWRVDSAVAGGNASAL